MPSVAKKEPFVGFTLKAMFATMILESSTLIQIQKAAQENFPRKFAKPASLKRIPKILSKMLRALHRGKLKFDKITTINVAPPTSLIKVKGVEFDPPKSFLKMLAKLEKVSKSVKSSKPEKEKEKSFVVSAPDDDEEEDTPKPSKSKSKSPPSIKKSKMSKPKAKSKPDNDEEEVEEVE